MELSIGWHSSSVVTNTSANAHCAGWYFHRIRLPLGLIRFDFFGGREIPRRRRSTQHVTDVWLTVVVALVVCLCIRAIRTVVCVCVWRLDGVLCFLSIHPSVRLD